jgi:hypothetical protein
MIMGMGFEFLISIFISFGISSIIALFLCIMIYFIHKDKQTEIVMSENDFNDSSVPGFNDEMIKLTYERINQEIQISNAIETKAGILVGSIGTFSAIFISILFVNVDFLDLYFDFFKKSFLFMIPFIIGSGFLIAAFVASIMVLTPRAKLKLANPRDANNFLATLNTANEVKRDLKEKLICFLEESIDETRKDAKTLRGAFVSFGIGIVILLVGLILPKIIPF